MHLEAKLNIHNRKVASMRFISFTGAQKRTEILTFAAIEGEQRTEFSQRFRSNTTNQQDLKNKKLNRELDFLLIAVVINEHRTEF